MSARAGRGRSVFVSIVVAVVGATVAVGVFVIGPPAGERARRLDERRTTELQDAARAVDRFWAAAGRLPATLAEASEREGPAYATADPATRREYEYRPVGGRRYELCAVFDGPSEVAGDPPRRAFWRHPAGRQCFSLEAPSGGP